VATASWDETIVSFNIPIVATVNLISVVVLVATLTVYISSIIKFGFLLSIFVPSLRLMVCPYN